MKFYKRDPDAALAGMSALNSAQRGIYNSIIDLLYSRDGMVACMTDADDRAIAKNISIDLREWRHIKRQLMELGKIRVTNAGLLTANGVQSRLAAAQLSSELARRSVTHRWDNYRLAKKLNGPAIQDRNTIQRQSKNSVLPSPQEHAEPWLVDNGENSESAERETTTTSIASDELAALVKRKQQFDKTWR